MIATVPNHKTGTSQAASREIPAATPRLTAEMLRNSTIYVPSFIPRVSEHESAKSRIVGDSIPLIVGSVLVVSLVGVSVYTGHVASVAIIGAVGGFIYGPVCLAFGISAYFELRRAKRNDKLNNR